MRPVPTVQPTRPPTTSPFGPITVIVDVTAGEGAAGRHLADVRAALDATGLRSSLEVVSSSEVAQAQARAAFDAGTRFVVAVGDDGTVQDVVDGAFRDGATIVERPVIGVVPAGTTCELIRSFGLPDDPEQAAVHLTGDATYPLDVMKVTATGEDGGRITRYGHNMVAVGFRAAIARRGGGVGRDTGRARRFAAFWSTYLRSRPRAMTLHVDTRSHEVRAWDVLVANGQFADGGQRLSPRSYPGDGVLDALAFVGPKADAYRMLPRIFMNGGHLPDPGVKELRAKIRVAIEPERPLPVTLDGRPLGRSPVTVQVVPQQVLLKL